MRNTILNTVIDQIVRPSQYMERADPELNGNMHRVGFWKVPRELLDIFEQLQKTKTPDPYIAIALKTGFITQEEIKTGKLPETWSMNKLLLNFGIDPNQTLITSINTTFRDNDYKVGTVSGFLYRKLSQKENPTKPLFEFVDVYKQLTYHNYLMEVCGRVAKRYVEDYGIKATARQKISNYHLIPSANKTNRDKVSKRIEEMMKNKDEPKCERIKSRNAEYTMKLIEDKKENYK